MEEQKIPTLTLTPDLDETPAKKEPDLLEKAEAAPEAGPELSALSPEEQQRIYRQMMDAPGVIVDDVCLSMVEKHLGTDALQAFFEENLHGLFRNAGGGRIRADQRLEPRADGKRDRIKQHLRSFCAN